MGTEQKIKINGVKSGLWLGLAITSLGIFYFYYITAIAKSAILLAAGPVFFYLFIPIFVIAFLCFDQRRKIGGFWTFKQATTGIFMMLLTAFILYSVAMNLIFYKFVEPDYLHKTQVAVINAKTQFMQQRGLDKTDVDKNIAQMNKDLAQQQNVTIGTIIQRIMIYILFIFIFSLVFGALFKKEPLVYATTSSD
jgi:hypothetical protein